MTTIESRLRRLEDEHAILRTLYAYGHSIDYGIEDEWLDLWTEDAVYYRPVTEPFRGRDALLALFHEDPHIPEVSRKHCLCEPRITIEGDRASAITYYFRFELEAGVPAVVSFGRYEDVLVRCEDERWRFRERHVENECGIRGYTPPAYGSSIQR